MATIFDDERRKKRKAELKERKEHQKAISNMYDLRADQIVDCMWDAQDSYSKEFVAVNLTEFYQVFYSNLLHIHGRYKNDPETEKFRLEIMRFIEEQRPRIVPLMQKRFKTNATEWQWV